MDSEGLETIKDDFDGLYHALCILNRKECVYNVQTTGKLWNVNETECTTLRQGFLTLYELVCTYSSDNYEKTTSTNVSDDNDTMVELKDELLQPICKALSTIVSRFPKTHASLLRHSDQVISVHCIADYYATQLEELCEKLFSCLVAFLSSNEKRKQ